MKNFKIKTIKLSGSADMRIRVKLYIAQLRKNIQSLSFIRFALPALMLGIFAFGAIQFTEINGILKTKNLATQSNILGELREIKTQMYKTKALVRVNMGRAQSYKNRAHIRSIRARKR